jgi:hypothetical protein
MILAPSPNFRTTDEDKKMLAFFDLLVERSSWISSGEEETTDSEDEDDEDDEDDSDDGGDDDNEYSTSHSSSPASSENEESFEIDSVSTPSSSSSEAEEPVAGPSGIQFNNLDESSKLELPSQFYTRCFPVKLTLKTSSSEDDDVERPTQERDQDPIVFRSLTENRKRQFRRRTNSSSSSS